MPVTYTGMQCLYNAEIKCGWLYCQTCFVCSKILRLHRLWYLFQCKRNPYLACQCSTCRLFHAAALHLLKKTTSSQYNYLPK